MNFHGKGSKPDDLPGSSTVADLAIKEEAESDEANDKTSEDEDVSPSQWKPLESWRCKKKTSATGSNENVAGDKATKKIVEKKKEQDSGGEEGA